MRIGKISESVYLRSVLKQLNIRNPEVLHGPGVGIPFSELECSKELGLATTMLSRVCHTKKDPVRLFFRVCNQIAAAGAEMIGISLSLLLPPSYFESELKELVGDLETKCLEKGISILQIEVETVEGIQAPILSMHGTGRRILPAATGADRMKPGQQLVLTKWIGLEGTAQLAAEQGQALKTRYPEFLIKAAAGFEDYLSIEDEAAIAVKSGVRSMFPVSEGGIFGALWEMAEASGVGLNLDLKAISIRQESIEICEYFDLNPYFLASGGCLLLATENGTELIKRLAEAGIHSAIIGELTDNKDRVVHNGEECRFLERPAADELHKIMAKKESNS